MKKLIFFIAVFLFTKTLNAQTEGIRYGLKAGSSTGKMVILPPLQNRTEHYGTGVVAGGVLEVPIRKKLRVQIEPLYHLHVSSIRFKNTDFADPKRYDLSLQQVSLPILVGYFIRPRWSVGAGVSANYNFHLRQKVTLDNWASPETFYTFNITDEITRFQPGILGGITFFATDNVFVDGRYHRLLTNSYKRPRGDNWTEYHLGSFQMALGYRF